MRETLRADTAKSKRKVVYTCLFGYSEPFLDQIIEDDGDTDFVCFTDDPSLRSDFWKIVLMPPSLLDPHRRSKGFKHRPHLFFPKHEMSLYIDNTVRLLKSPSNLFDILEENEENIILFAHPYRNCIYDEAEIVKSVGYDGLDVIDAQVNYYKSINVPPQNGLHATTFILRRHNNPDVMHAMDEWHYQLLRHSKRDQISFDAIRYIHSMKVRVFDGELTNNTYMVWPTVPGGKRLPRDFDDSEYLELHPDVAQAGLNPRKHYLDYGIDEGRPYRIPSNTNAASAEPSKPAIPAEHGEQLDFDANWYLTMYPDVAASGLEPLDHYRQIGNAQGRYPAPQQRVMGSAGHWIYFNPDDARGRALLAAGGALNPATHCAWHLLLGSGAWTHVIDVGANYGEMLANGGLPPEAAVVAIEPNPIVRARLQETLDAAGLVAMVLDEAVSNAEGQHVLQIDESWSGTSRLADDTEGDGHPVRTTTLSDVIRRAGELPLAGIKVAVKIDVEGHEIEVLQGILNDLPVLGDFAALIEVEHASAEGLDWFDQHFKIQMLREIPLPELVPIEPGKLRAALSSDLYYKRDIVLRRRIQD